MVAERPANHIHDCDWIFAFNPAEWVTESRIMIPGRALHRVAAALCSAKTLERAVEPAIADLQREYGIVAGNTVSRLWVLITGYGAILKVIVICALSVSIETDDERRALRRV